MVIDFDSTFVKLEALEELSKIALEGNPDKEAITEEIEKITRMGMEGKITFPESLGRRLRLFSANKQNVERLVQLLEENITDSVLENKDFFRANADRIYIISGGFKDFVLPITEQFEIPKDHVLANDFIYDKAGNIAGVDQNNLLAQDEGKIKAVQNLKLKGKVCVIGDGYTDYQIKAAGAANDFIAFCENVRRESVVEKASCEINGFDKLPAQFLI